mgnify:CR=1 FL=1
MTYHNISSTTITQGQTTPTKKIIQNFILDTSDIRSGGESRGFKVIGTNGAVFSLQVKNEDDYYYNFATNLFQVTSAKLNNVTLGVSGFYSGNIKFPTVTDADKYDIYLLAESNQDTIHANYNEVRFGDNSIDINSSTGSNSNLVQKVIYQTLDVTITLASFSPTGIVTGAVGTQVITTSRNAGISLIPFSFIYTVTSLKSLKILKQPVSSDIFASVTKTIGATPLQIEGEDIYPTVTNTDVVNGNFGLGSTNKIVMDTNVADKMIVGDRVTTAAMTDTVDGTILVGMEGPQLLRVVMDNNVDTKMAAGDRITIESRSRAFSYFENNIITVAALNPDMDNVKKFSCLIDNEEKLYIEDGVTLTFTSRLNREVVTVVALNPDTDNVKEFAIGTVTPAGTAPANIGIRDNATLSFSSQRNYRWSTDIHGLTPGMRVRAGDYFGADPVIQGYLTQTIVNEGELGEYRVDNVRVPALDAFGALPVKTRNGTTNIETITQDGNVTFSEQALKSLGGASLAFYSYGTTEIERLTGHDVEFSDLAVALTKITTTTTTAPSAATTFNVASAVGIAENISTVSGIGIDASVINPTVTTITNVGGATWNNSAGATLTLGVAQTLESGTTLTFPNAGTVATITGNIKVNKVGNENVILRFDLERFLAMQAAP